MLLCTLGMKCFTVVGNFKFDLEKDELSHVCTKARGLVLFLTL